jgi:MFS family permease
LRLLSKLECVFEREDTLAASSQSLIDRLLVNRNFAFLWVGDVISALGDYSFGITMTLWIVLVIAKGQPWAPLAITGLVLSGTIPPMIVGLFAGVFVDRWDHRLTMMVVDLIQAALVAVLVATTFLPGGQLQTVWQLIVIYIVNFLLVSVDQFYNQAGFPLIGDIVPEQDFARAMGRVLIFVSIGTILGPSIGAPLFFVFGARYALLINAVSFLISFALILPIRPPRVQAQESKPAEQEPKKRAFLPEFIDGLRFLFTHRTLRTMLVAMIIETLGTAALPVVNVFFVIQNLHASGAFYGLLVTALGMGTLVGSIFGPRIISRWGEGRIFWACLYADGIFLIIYSRLTNFIPAVAIIFILGIVGGFFNVAIGPLILRLTPRNMMGRGTAVRVSLISVANILGAAAAGFLVSDALRHLHVSVLGTVFTPVDTILLAAGLFALLSGIYAMKNVFEPEPVATPVTAETSGE